MINFLRKAKRALFPSEGAKARTSLLNQMMKNGKCAEIGAWKGDFTQQILKITAPKKLFLIDPYEFVGDYKKAWYGGVAGGQERMDQVFEGVQKRFKKQINEGTLEMIRKKSDTGLAQIEDGSLDWIYIDGNHLYEFVKKDLALSWEKVKVNGYITGDDYGLVGWWDDGVTKAVDEFVKERNDSLEAISFEGTQFILKKISD